MVHTKKALEHRKSKPTEAKKLRPGTAALRQIRQYQKSVDFLMQKLPFARLVRREIETLEQELKIEIGAQDEAAISKVQASAIEELQYGFENYIVQVFQGANILAIQVGKRVSVSPKEIAIYCDMHDKHLSVTEMSVEEEAKLHRWNQAVYTPGSYAGIYAGRKDKRSARLQRA